MEKGWRTVLEAQLVPGIHTPVLNRDELRLVYRALWVAWNEIGTGPLEEGEEGKLCIKLATMFPFLKEDDDF